MGNCWQAGARARAKMRAFTLMEIVFGFLIVAILLGLTATNLRSSVQQEGPRGLAYTLASDLRAARAEAQRSGKMVAVGFASEGRSNSLSRSAVIRKGDQRGHISRILNYGNEYKGAIFLGTWPGSQETTVDVPLGWDMSTADTTTIYFRPDGSAFSNELPAIEGNYPLVVATSFLGNLNGPSGTLSHALNPHTVWVSAAGSVTVDESSVPSGTLPVPTGEAVMSVAELDLSKEPSPSSPNVIFTKFLPEKVDGLDMASIGQNFVSVHPNQKEGGYLEYGVATIEIKAKDSDGGPLTYRLEATASRGAPGEFTVSNLEGKMRYVFDETEKDHVWHSVISWRPPPGAAPDLVYDLKVTVQDPEGNSVEIVSGARLPRVTSLPPSRLVMNTADRRLYLANLDGANEIHINKNGGEFLPFFSADGSRVFSFHDQGTTRELRSRAADGSSSFERLATFQNGGGTEVKYDPTYTYAAIINADGFETYAWDWIKVIPGSSGTTNEDGTTTGETAPSYELHHGNPPNTPTKYKILIVNLMSNDPPIQVTDRAARTEPHPGSQPEVFRWHPGLGLGEKYTFFYHERTVADMVTNHNYTYIPQPGWKIDDTVPARRLDGYPPSIASVPNFEGDASEHFYNPAQPTWFMQIDGSGSAQRLALRKTGGTEDITLFTGNIENVPEQKRTPTWSADGQSVAFVVSGSKVVTMKVLDESHAALPSPITDFVLDAPGLSMAQIAPNGKWVYYLRGGKLYRSENATGAPEVDISTRIDANLIGYVIAP